MTLRKILATSMLGICLLTTQALPAFSQNNGNAYGNCNGKGNNGNGKGNTCATAVPEPSATLLLALGLGGVVTLDGRRRRRVASA